MSIETKWLAGLLLALALASVSAPPAGAAPPMQEIKDTTDRVLGILEDPSNGGDHNRPERRELLRRVISPLFDFSEMARIALGVHWNEQGARQREFVAVFKDFVEMAYVSRIEALKNQQVVYVREQVGDGVAQVETRIVPAMGEAVPVHYKLRLVGGEWKIYDVLVENVSLIENYRSQFQRILVLGSFDELLKRLREKIPSRGG